MGIAPPNPYKRFLICSRGVTFTDTLSFGLPYTFLRESPSDVPSPTHGMLCFGDCFWEADGDHVLFDLSAAHESLEPPVVYYAHNDTPSSVRWLATDFHAWVEGLSKSHLFA